MGAVFEAELDKDLQRDLVALERLRRQSYRASQKLAGLSLREREVLLELSSGHSNKGVARQLGISPRTVEIHRANIMRKMNTGSLVEAVRIVFEATLFESLAHRQSLD